MSRSAEGHGWARGCETPLGPGVYEVTYMGRRMKVQVNRNVSGHLMVYGVPGHMEEGVPILEFDMFNPPRVDDSRRSATSNLSEYDRAASRAIAGLTALRATVSDLVKMEKRLSSDIKLLLVTVMDRAGVEDAVKERLAVWDIEDHDGIPLPSYGPGAPLTGMDLNGREI